MSRISEGAEHQVQLKKLLLMPTKHTTQWYCSWKAADMKWPPKRLCHSADKVAHDQITEADQDREDSAAEDTAEEDKPFAWAICLSEWIWQPSVHPPPPCNPLHITKNYHGWDKMPLNVFRMHIKEGGLRHAPDTPPPPPSWCQMLISE